MFSKDIVSLYEFFASRSKSLRSSFSLNNSCCSSSISLESPESSSNLNIPCASSFSISSEEDGTTGSCSDPASLFHELLYSVNQLLSCHIQLHLFRVWFLPYLAILELYLGLRLERATLI